MAEVGILIVGLVVGTAVGWLWAKSRLHGEAQAEREQVQGERERRVAAETRLTEIEKQLEAQRSLVEEAKAQLGDTFKALSSDALRDNAQAFVQSANQTLEPLRESLRRYEEHLREIEGARQRAYGSLEEQLKSLLSSEQQLQRETSNLVTALRRPEVRGQWGEMKLRRLVELSGMTEHCDFDVQVTVPGDRGSLRIDMVVRLPNDCSILVDSKAPMDAYFDALNAEDAQTRKGHLTRHCRQIRDHVSALASKSYWSHFESAPEYVIMFVPADSFLQAAYEIDPTIIEAAVSERVLIAGPMTLMAMLGVAARGWRQEQMAKSAQEISNLGGELYRRLRTFVGHLANMGRRLHSATESYNDAVGSLERSVLPQARRFRDLGAAGGDEIAELEPLDTQPRELTAPEANEEE